jgi:hypothetical protein
MTGVELLVLLLTVAPSLATEIINLLNKGGHVTAQEWTDYIVQRWPDKDSFFGTKAPGTTTTTTTVTT